MVERPEAHGWAAWRPGSGVGSPAQALELAPEALAGRPSPRTGEISGPVCGTTGGLWST